MPDLESALSALHNEHVNSKLVVFLESLTHIDSNISIHDKVRLFRTLNSLGFEAYVTKEYTTNERLQALLARLSITELYSYEINLALIHSKESAAQLSESVSCRLQLKNLAADFVESTVSAGNSHEFDELQKLWLIKSNRPFFAKQFKCHLARTLPRRLLNACNSDAHVVSVVKSAFTKINLLPDSDDLMGSFMDEIKRYLEKTRKGYKRHLIRLMVDELVNVPEDVSLRVHQYGLAAVEKGSRNFDLPLKAKKEDWPPEHKLLVLLGTFFTGPEEIVAQFKKLLADGIKDCETDQDSRHAFYLKTKRTLEKLRRIYPYHGWLDCDIMLKDFEDSAWLSAGTLHLFQVSDVYWPEVALDADVILPNCLEAYRQNIEHLIAQKCPSKVYHLTNTFSKVDLEIEFANCTIPASCSADEAAVLVGLLEAGPSTFDDLRAGTNLSEERLSSAISRWLKYRVVEMKMGAFQVPENFAYPEHALDLGKVPKYIDIDLGLATQKGPMESVDSALGKLLPLICGTLTNIGPLPLHGVHERLKKISLSYKHDETELHFYLESQVANGMLSITAEGFYSVIRQM